MTTLPELAKILGGLAIAYPRFTLRKETVGAYHRILADIDADLLDKAGLHHASTSTFFPSAAELRRAAFDLWAQAEGLPSAQDAWAEVIASFRTHGYYRSAPDWTHELIGKAVKAIGGYAFLCTSSNPTADRARFLQAYDAYLERYRKQAAMLPDVRRMVGIMAGKGVARLSDGRKE